MKLQPTTLEELIAFVQAGPGPLVPRGGGSKSILSRPPAGAQALDMSHMKGIRAYDPGEYTFTAFAATPIAEIRQELARHGQYLPFDPLLVDRGSTLGGVVAANTAGSGRYRYGGVRDFILQVYFVDGNGRYVRSGGKVVKNSAGFDLPKFMVGSLGAYGVLVELTFKVFPKPSAYTTLSGLYGTLPAALDALYRLATTPFEMDALDLEPAQDNQFALIVRLGGLPEALPGRFDRLQQFLKVETAVTEITQLAEQDEQGYWQAVNSFRPGHGFNWNAESQNLIKVPLTPKQIPLLDNNLRSIQRRYIAGGNVAWLSGIDAEQCDQVLNDLGLVGLQLIGAGSKLYLGQRKGLVLAQRVKQALDPAARFREV